MKIKLFNCCFILALLLGSCSIQKRVHRPGYAIEWNLGKRIKHAHQQAARSKAPGNKAELAQAGTTAGEFPAARELAAINTSTASEQCATTHQVKTRPHALKAASPKSSINIHKSETTKEVKQYKPVQQTNDDNIIKGLLFVLVALLLLG